jgi:hypothetical protein
MIYNSVQSRLKITMSNIQNKVTGFIIKIKLNVYKGITFDYECDRIKDIIYDKYDWAMKHIDTTVYDEDGEISYDLLDDFIYKSGIPLYPSDSSKKFTQKQLGGYIKQYKLDIPIIEYINAKVLNKVVANTSFNYEDATLTFTVNSFNTDQIGDIDRYLYEIRSKLNNLYISECMDSFSYEEGRSLHLFETFKLDMNPLIDKFKEVECLKDDPRLLETTLDIKGCLWGTIHILKDDHSSQSTYYINDNNNISITEIRD